MLGTLIDLFSTSGLGAIVGLVGSFLTKVEDRKLKKLTFEHDERMAKIRTDELRLEGEQKIQLAETEGEIASDIERQKSFTESLKEQSMLYGIRFVDAVRGLMRPVITIFLLIVSSWLAVNVYHLAGGLQSMPENDVIDLFREIVTQILFLTTTAVTWWFGSRPSSKRKD